jgi:hypothetical protein
MRKSILAVATGAVLAAAAFAPTAADARCRGCGVAAGVIGGLAAGAIIGGAIANSGPAYAAPVPLYGEPPVYGEPVYVGPRRACFAEEEYWSHRHQTYMIRRVRVPCY